MKRLASLLACVALTVAACGGSDEPTPDKTTPEPEPTVDLSASSPEGEFELTDTVTESDYPDEEVGDEYKDTTWTFTACEGDPCSGTIKSTSGASFTYVWDGNEVVVERDGGNIVEDAVWGCEFEEDWTPSFNAPWTYTYHPLKAEPVAEGARVKELSGPTEGVLDLTKMSKADTYDEAAVNCDKPSKSEVIDWYGGETISSKSVFHLVQK